MFFQKGIFAGVLGTGMTDVHSVREYVELPDMVRACEMALELTALYHENAEQYQP